VGRGGGCTFERVVGMEMFGATGGASPLPYEKREGYCGCETNSALKRSE